MNWIGLYTLYKKEMSRTFRVPMQTLLSPVLTTALYFIVFGSTIGARVGTIDGVSYAQFIIPGLIMMSLLTNSLSAASSGIYFPKFIGTIYELLSAPLSFVEIILGFTLAAATRALIIGTLIYLTALLFIPLPVAHPLAVLFFSFLTAFSFALFGLIIGIWADSFEKLNLFPLLILTPLSFLGGVFYSLDMLPPFWQKISLLNPVVYMISALRWGFFDTAHLSPLTSLALISGFLLCCILALIFMFKTGYKIKN